MVEIPEQVIKTDQEILAERRQMLVDYKKLQDSSEWKEMCLNFGKKCDANKEEIMRRVISGEEGLVTVSETNKELSKMNTLKEIIDSLPNLPGSVHLRADLENKIDIIKHNFLTRTVLNFGTGLVNTATPIYTETDLLRFQASMWSDLDAGLHRAIHGLEDKKQKEKDELETEWQHE